MERLVRSLCGRSSVKNGMGTPLCMGEVKNELTSCRVPESVLVDTAWKSRFKTNHESLTTLSTGF